MLSSSAIGQYQSAVPSFNQVASAGRKNVRRTPFTPGRSCQDLSSAFPVLGSRSGTRAINPKRSGYLAAATSPRSLRSRSQVGGQMRTRSTSASSIRSFSSSKPIASRRWPISRWSSGPPGAHGRSEDCSAQIWTCESQTSIGLTLAKFSLRQIVNDARIGQKQPFSRFSENACFRGHSEPRLMPSNPIRSILR